MSKIWIVFEREYLTRVKTKGFIIGTILTPLFLILLSIGPGFLMNLNSEKSKIYSIVDLSGIVYDELVQILNDTISFGNRLYDFTRITASIENLDSVKNELNQAIVKNLIDGYFIIPSDIVEKSEAQYCAKSVSNFDDIRTFQSTISQIVRNYRIEQSNLDLALVNKLTRLTNLRTYKICKAEEIPQGEGVSFIIAFIMVLFLQMTFTVYGNSVMRSIFVEKQSRVLERIVSSYKPYQLMASKVLGIGAVGLTQYFIWAAGAALLTNYSGAIMEMFTGGASGFSMPTIPIAVLVYFIIFFALGYLLFATIYAGLGAMVNTDQDMQQFQSPVMMFINAALFLAFYIIENPTAGLSKIVSLIPFFSPITMFTRIAIQMPLFSEILLSIIILVLTIIFLFWLDGKIFRVGILMYGKRPTLSELIYWIWY